MFGIPAYLQSIGIVVVLGAAAIAYDRFIDDPAVADKARVGYVAYAEKRALEAELNESKRQLTAANNSIKSFAQALDKVRMEQQLDDAKYEKEVAAYERKLAEQGRRCDLVDDDIDFLQR